MAFAFCTTPLVQAQLVFERTEADIKAEPGAAVVPAKFTFKVAGKEKVTLFSTEADCGCTAVSLTKQIYEPGETGEIAVNFSVGDRVGPQLKHVRVRASDQTEPHVLTFKTEIPIFASVRPQFVVWSNKEDPLPKKVTFELGESSPTLEGLTASSNNPGMTPVVHEIVKGRKYEVEVTPTQTEQFFLATLQLTARLGGDKPARIVLAYATVQPPANTAPVPTQSAVPPRPGAPVQPQPAKPVAATTAGR